MKIYILIVMIIFFNGCKIVLPMNPIEYESVSTKPKTITASDAKKMTNEEITKALNESIVYNRHLNEIENQKKYEKLSQEPSLKVDKTDKTVISVKSINILDYDINSQNYWLFKNIATFTLNIKEGISVNLLSGVIYKDKVEDSNIVWSSSDNTIAVVDQQGRITAKKVGKATITASSKLSTSIKNNLELNVSDKITNIPKSPILGYGTENYVKAF
jgi:hypothetical protein